MHGLNVLRCLWLIPQRPANLAHTHLEHGIAHMHPSPYGPQEFLFGHELAGAFCQVAQDRQGFGFQRDCVLAVPELLVEQIEPKRAESQFLL